MQELDSQGGEGAYFWGDTVHYINIAGQSYLLTYLALETFGCPLSTKFAQHRVLAGVEPDTNRLCLTKFTENSLIV